MTGIKLFLLFLIILITSIVLYLEFFSPNQKITNTFSGTHQWLVAIATVVIAVFTIFSVKIQKRMVEVSSSMANIAELSVNQDKIKLQAELRPYLILQLNPEPNIYGTQEYLKKDGNSQYYWQGYFKENFLILPFKIKNVGKIPAINIKAKYDSPSQSDVWFKIGENSLAPENETAEVFRPWVNILTIKNNNEIKQFEIQLKITYKGNEEIDSRTYYSILKLNILKAENDVFLIIDSDFQFGTN